MQVICEAGYSGCDHPKAFTWQDCILAVKYVIKEWREPDSKHFLVSVENNSHFELVFSETGFIWNIIEVSGSPNH